MHAFHKPTMRTRDAVCASVRRHQHVSRVLYLQDMSIDVYGRKEEDDAPQEEAASSSNGVRHLLCYTMSPNWNTGDPTVPGVSGHGVFQLPT